MKHYYKHFVLAMFAIIQCTSLFGQTYASIPYTTGFESGSLDPAWTATSSQSGINIEVIQTGTLTWSTETAVSHSGNYFLGLDYGTGGVYNLNQADLHLNTAGQSNLTLDFWWAEWNDETEAQDGIFISDDGGVTFTKVLDLNGASYTDLTWTNFVLDLDNINSTYGLNYSAQYIIRFQQYDNYYFAGGNDGFLFDDISITNPCPATVATISASTCGSYTVPSGDETYSTSGMYNDTIPNINGCDSLLTIDLTIYPSTNSSITESTCSAFLSPAGNTYSTSGIYYDTIPNANGCDSVITIDLTVNAPTSSSITESVIDSYTAPSGAVYTATGIYYDTIPNANGCDSIITIDLTVNYTGVDEESIVNLNVYPNPVRDQLFIQGLESLKDVVAIEIVDATGKRVLKIQPTSDTIDCSQLNKGTYHMVITTNNHEHKVQFVKQ